MPPKLGIVGCAEIAMHLADGTIVTRDLDERGRLESIGAVAGRSAANPDGTLSRDLARHLPADRTGS